MRRDFADNPDAHLRFLREARAIAALKHDNIVPIFQIDEKQVTREGSEAEVEQSVVFLIMPLLEGESLEARLNREAALPIPLALRIAMHVAAGLAAAHVQGIVHRDIKPGNIWLQGKFDHCGNGEMNRAIILDFGLARFDDNQARTSLQNDLAGTPEYMAPEQASAEPIDQRVDLFSLGVVLYQMATGKNPFAHTPRNVIATLMSLTTYQPEIASRLNPQVPPELDQLLTELLQKNPEGRIEKASEVVARLKLIREKLRSEIESPPEPGSVDSLPPTTVDLSRTAVPNAPQSWLRSSSKTRWMGLGAIAFSLLVSAIVITRLQARNQVERKNTESLTTSTAPESTFPADAPPLAIAPFDAYTARRHQETWAKYLQTPMELQSSSGIRLSLIPPGKFVMGLTDADAELAVSEINQSARQYALVPDYFGTGFITEAMFDGSRPEHSMQISRSFYMAIEELTIEQFRKFVDATDYITDRERQWAAVRASGKPASHSGIELNWKSNGGISPGNHGPVIFLSWNDAQAYCDWLSKVEKATYRLPTQAEWEFACRAGTTTLWVCGNSYEKAVTLANLGYATSPSNAPKTNPVTQHVDPARGFQKSHYFPDGYLVAAPVGSFPPNPFGLSDMHGNVSEWCSDRVLPRSPRKPVTQKKDGPPEKRARRARGGAWSLAPRLSLSGVVNGALEDFSAGDIGFRIVREVPASSGGNPESLAPARFSPPVTNSISPKSNTATP
jgi:formylglycine-generating enzyme required for sulfatase activity